MNITKITATILAVLATVGVLFLIGYLPYRFVGYILLLMIVYLYVTLSQIDDILLRSLGLITIMGIIVGWWTGLFDGLKQLLNFREGFYVSPLKKISDALTARQCQDTCQSAKMCKYSQVPLGTIWSGAKNACWNSYGLNQNTSGSKRQGGDTWQNRLYRQPITVGERRGYHQWNSSVVTWKTNSGRKHRLMISDVRVNMIPAQLRLYVSLRDQGWGNRTWGIYVVGYDARGKEAFKEVLKAPRTSRQVNTPVYQNYTYNQRVRRRGRRSRYWHGRRAPAWIFRKWLWGHWHYRNQYYWTTIRRTGRRLVRYNKKNVQGGLQTKNLIANYNIPNYKNVGPITRIKVYAETRGQGHALEAGRVDWRVRGWPLGGSRGGIKDYSRKPKPRRPPVCCPSGWRRAGNRCYKRQWGKRTWNQAAQHCRNQGATLPIIGNQTQNNMVLRLGAGWLGYSDRHQEGRWRWEDGSTGNFTKWSRGEPNDYRSLGGEDVAGMYSNGTWNDWPGAANRVGNRYRFQHSCSRPVQNCGISRRSSPTISIIGRKWVTPRKNNLVRSFVMKKDYKLEFHLHAKPGRVSGWSNILHSTLSRNNCCNRRDRVPAVWFFPGSKRLHIRTSTNSVGNYGHDPPMQIPDHANVQVTIIVQGSRLTVRLRGTNGKGPNYNWQGRIDPNRQSGTTYFYVSDPWYVPALCYVQNVKFTNL